MNDLRLLSLAPVPQEFVHGLESMGFHPILISEGEADAVYHSVPPGNEPDLLHFLGVLGRHRPPAFFIELDRSELARAISEVVDLGFRCAWIRLSGSSYTFVGWQPT